MVRRTVICSASLFCVILVISYSSFTPSNLVEGKGQSVCPTTLKKILGDDTSCKKLKCETKLNAKTCPENTEFKENVASCGCCPACVRYQELKEFEECVEPTYEDCGEKVCPVLMPICGAGLICSSTSNTCTKFSASTQLTCEIKLAMYRDEKLHWQPSCNPDGTYAPKQCKGKKGTTDGMCFCSDEDGNRIFGRKQWTEEAANMTCACSLHAHKLRQGNQISTLHCTPDGNYETLQCDTDSGLCYCVNALTGKLTGAVLPERQWQDLPCYTKSLGESYLRKCDSLWAATQRIRREASLHGLDLQSYADIDCDYDGSYKRYQHISSTEECWDKAGIRILSYFRQSGTNGNKMTCNCAREPYDYDAEQIPGKTKPCDQWGNFDTVYQNGNEAFCIDDDGFAYHKAPIKLSCCLINQCAVVDRAQCYSASNPTGIKTCDSIIT